MARSLRRALLAGALLSAPTVAPLGAQTPAPAAPAARLNIVDARLADAIRSLAAALGLNVVLSDVPDRRVTFTSATALGAREVGAVLESLLEAHGLVLVQQGAVARVLPAERAPATGPVGVGLTLPDPPPLGLVTQLVPLQGIRADEGAAALRQLAAPSARIEPVARSNALLITDRGANVARYLEVLARLDTPAQGEAGLRTYVVPLKYAGAEDLAATLGQLFGVQTAAPRGGSLGDRSLGRALDTFRQREQDQFRQRSLVPNAVTTDATRPIAPQPAGAASDPVGVGARPDSGGPAQPGALVGQTIVVANAPTNALVIRTQPPNFPLLRETIEALDARPVQVLLEVTVAEVALGRGSEFGIDWAASSRAVTGGVANTAVQQNNRVADTLPVANPGLLVRRLLRFDDLDVRALLRAVSTRNQVNVLSTPEILAMNNREARILVGSKVPFVASSRLGDFSRDQAVQYQDVGTTLTIVPTVNDDDYVSVQILQEVSALTSQTLPSALNAPVITTREAATRAVLRDGQTVVIAGLIGDERSVEQTGVPLLADIPWLGNLFRRTSVTRNRTELAIFVTPRVVRSDAQADALRERARRRLDAVPAPPPE
ncbi:secretin N-terminal domain-containing protein [Roseisolibacter sp. H3M3-2]|uniref:secretin N-terminal domain-containing protein n=1 Tax=Roseisolibacter sp. H3M3-2 TaxID=3031323 RepID=UPI0023DAD592|nr:secretin N-terminal domain-containing protein [Roseisolibacter sp. H3M3-2]MDF1506048.1 secretin N-terminal domain-containing protein [Roseisolibacter sp. H3M3-2]